MAQPPQSFELALTVQPADIDQLGHVNNVTYLRWVQEAAMAHWYAAASAADVEQLLWVVLRHEIDYRQPAFLEDRIVARTWVGSATRVTFERFTEVLRASDRAVLASARTVWCPIGRHTGKPINVSAGVRARFSVDSHPGAGTP